MESGIELAEGKRLKIEGEKVPLKLQNILENRPVFSAFGSLCYLSGGKSVRYFEREKDVVQAR
jgi:hypothetical protein